MTAIRIAVKAKVKLMMRYGRYFGSTWKNNHPGPSNFTNLWITLFETVTFTEPSTAKMLLRV